MVRRSLCHKIALVKIAPGPNAEYWSQCLEGGYICVGWDKIGDLRKFDSEERFRKVFEKLFHYGDHLPAKRQKGSELWTLTKLQPGDRVIANKGMTEILAVGVVQEPGYRWRPDQPRSGYYHTVSVKWDTSFARKIEKQPWNQTVTEVPYQR